MIEQSEPMTTKKAQMHRWLKALGRINDGPVFWWFTGVTYGLTADDGLKPLFRHENFSFGNYSCESADRHVSRMQDVTFYRHLETGELLRDFDNPYTNETRPVIEVVTNDINNFYDVNGLSGFIADGQEFARPLSLDVAEADDRIWMTRAMNWAFPSPLDPEKHSDAWGGSTIRMQMETTLMASMQDIDSPAVHSADCQASYEAITPWFPWMHMGTREGWVITRATGIKLASWEQLPKQTLEAAEERFPGCVTGKAPPPSGKDPWSDYLAHLEN